MRGRPSRSNAETPLADKGAATAERALQVLDAFLTAEEPLSLRDLGKRTGFYNSTLLRLLASLARFGCVNRLDDGRYQLGAKVLLLGSAFRSTFKLDDYVPPVLDRLVRETAESATFYVPQGDARLCLFRVNSAQPLRDHMHIGEQTPITPVGAQLRSNSSADQAIRAFSAGAPVENRPALPIITQGERLPGIASMSVPVFWSNGLLGALTLSGPASRFDQAEMRKCAPILIREAMDLSRALGGSVAAFHEVEPA
ncbi:helix-turn-helix domain-containing protein [Xanthobacter sp. VNH20]|uniref:IclR family transcriptional regulator n=1 Tax=Xanthobacter sp. VNH20 TaxID=3156616 RepID=UPI0032B42875